MTQTLTKLRQMLSKLRVLGMSSTAQRILESFRSVEERTGKYRIKEKLCNHMTGTRTAKRGMKEA